MNKPYRRYFPVWREVEFYDDLDKDFFFTYDEEAIDFATEMGYPFLVIVDALDQILDCMPVDPDYIPPASSLRYSSEDLI